MKIYPFILTLFIATQSYAMSVNGIGSGIPTGLNALSMGVPTSLSIEKSEEIKYFWRQLFIRPSKSIRFRRLEFHSSQSRDRSHLILIENQNKETKKPSKQ